MKTNNGKKESTKVTSKGYKVIKRNAKKELNGIVKSIFVAENILNGIAKGKSDYCIENVSKENFQEVARLCRNLVLAINPNSKKYFDICLFSKNSKGISCLKRSSKRCPKWGLDIVSISANKWEYLQPIALTETSVFDAFSSIVGIDIQETEKAEKAKIKEQKRIEKETAKIEKAKSVVTSIFGDIANIMTKEQILEKYDIIRNANKRTRK